jgi:hypothetical protein
MVRVRVRVSVRVRVGIAFIIDYVEGLLWLWMKLGIGSVLGLKPFV